LLVHDTIPLSAREHDEALSETSDLATKRSR
jgi:hypothetical protein